MRQRKICFIRGVVMKPSASTVLRLSLAALFALGCFTLGYLAPHHREALAQTPHPASSVPFDNVPGGVGGHGSVLVTGASTTMVGGQQISAWPCMKNDHCRLDFQFRFVVPPATPAPYACPRPLPHCLSFSGKSFRVQSVDRYGKAHPEGGSYAQANVAGKIQLLK